MAVTNPLLLLLTLSLAMSKPLAVIVGVGDGLSASLARLLFKNGYSLALAARDPGA